MGVERVGRGSSKSFWRRVKEMLVAIVGFVIVCVIVLLGLLLAWSPGKPKPIVDAQGNPVPGSISEKVWVNINGEQQGMFIKSRDPANPVLLFMHGGPGMPEYFLTRTYPTGLEDHFTVVWWERRGAGLSYSPDIAPESMTVGQAIDDTLEVTNYLRSRFHKDKIYLMAHSGGSYIGIQAAARKPELYYAYIGMGQMAYQLKSENESYAYMLEQYRANGNTKMLQKLESTPVTMTVPLPDAYMQLRDDAMHTIGVGTTRDMRSVVTGIFVPVWQMPDYTLAEKLNIWRGKGFSQKMMWNDMIATDLTQKVTELNLPVYFFSGRYDYTVSRTLAQAYLDCIHAPVKGFYTFENSAHSPLFEEPEKVLRILQEDVEPGKVALADGK